MHLICVDDEQPALDNFRLTVAQMSEVTSLHCFQTGAQALEWAKDNPVDMAFLDMEMPGLHGLQLAQQLKELDGNVRLVFVTAYAQYALEAFAVDAIGYVLKPYSRGDIRKELEKAALIRPKPALRVCFQTIPTFSATVDGKPLRLGRAKTIELLALLVDRGERGITTGEGIAYLWPERPGDANTQSLFRVTYKRLADSLEKAGIGSIVGSEGNRRFLRTGLVDCDLYRILSGEKEAARRYAGEYMREYSWAEERNGQLYRMLLSI